MEGNSMPAFPAKAERRSSAKAESTPLISVDVTADDRGDGKAAVKQLLQPSTPTASSSPAGSSGSDADAVFNMVNAILGAGVLGYPFCFRSCGVGLATTLILVCWTASHFSMRLLLLAAHLVGARTYEDLARTVLGRSGQQTLTACIFILNLGCLVAYVNILADVLSSVAGSIIPPGAEPSRNTLLTAITLFGVWPVALVVRSPEVLARVSQASVVFIFAFAAVVAYLAVQPRRTSPFAAKLEMWRWEGMLIAFPVIAYGFTAQQFLFGIYASLRVPSVRRMTGIIHKALLLCTSVYLVVGISGYAAFRQRTSGDILRNFGTASAARMVKVGYGLALLGTVPLVVMPFHDSMLPLVGCLGATHEPPPGAPATPLQQQAITSLVLGASLAAAVLVPNVEFIFGLTGSTAAALLAFIFPAWVFLLAATPLRTSARADLDLLPWQWGGMRNRAWLLLAMGVVVGVACTRATLMAVHQEKEVVQLAQNMAASQVEVAEATRRHAAAVQVAETVETVSTAAAQVGSAQLHANATRTSAAQAQAALESLDTSRGVEKPHESSLHSSDVTGTAEGVAQELTAAQGAAAGRKEGRESDAAHAGHVESFALGSVMTNLRDMKARVNSTLLTFEAVTAALNATSARLREEQQQLEAEQHVRNETLGGSEADQAGDRAAAPSSTAWTMQKEREVAKQEAHALRQVQRRANETLAAIRATATALAAAEAAVDAVERAKGQPDDPATREAVRVMLAAVTATGEAAKRVDATLAELQQLQEEQAAQLTRLQRSRQEQGGASSAARRAMPRDSQAGSSELDETVSRAPPGLQGAVDVTVVAQAAVAAASTELGAALAKAKSANLTLARTQQEDPEGATRAEEIARELGRVARESEEAAQVLPALAPVEALSDNGTLLFGQSLA